VELTDPWLCHSSTRVYKLTARKVLLEYFVNICVITQYKQTIGHYEVDHTGQETVMSPGMLRHDISCFIIIIPAGMGNFANVVLKQTELEDHF